MSSKQIPALQFALNCRHSISSKKQQAVFSTQEIRDFQFNLKKIA